MAAKKTFRAQVYDVVFRNDNPLGQRFDLTVIWLIIASVIIVIVESVDRIGDPYDHIFKVLEWTFTIVFTIEYILRIYSATERWKYIFSFYGLVDFLAIVPSYLGIFFAGGQQLLIIRVLRLLRIFRIFQMGHFVREGAIVASALRASQVKITVFLSFVVIASIFTGALMYIVEADYNKEIQNIPEGIYWAIVTLTTVGYGDTIPVTSFGKFLASVVMILGYGVIAVPTGIVTAEISSRVLGPRDRLKIKCTVCGDGDHLRNSTYCHSCGAELPVPPVS